MKATFSGYETQQGLSVNKLLISSKLCNPIHSVSVLHTGMYTLCPCSEKFLELGPTSLHTNVNRLKKKKKGN